MCDCNVRIDVSFCRVGCVVSCVRMSVCRVPMSCRVYWCVRVLCACVVCIDVVLCRVPVSCRVYVFVIVL